MAKKKLDQVYINLWGPHHLELLAGKTYVAILLDKKTHKTQVIYLQLKDQFINTFQIWLSKVEKKSNKSLKILHTDGEGGFILAKLKDICDWQGITIKYVALYMYEENGLAELGWRTIAIMKNSLLIDSNLPLEFWVEVMDIANYLYNCLPTKSQQRELITKEI